MKHLLLFSALCCSIVALRGQSINVGDTTPAFYHARYSPVYRIQDTIYDYVLQNMNDQLAVDLDGDGITDVTLVSSYYETNSGNVYFPVWRAGVLTDSLTDIVVITSAFTNADTLNIGDIIDDSNNWQSGNIQLCQNINNYNLDSTWKDHSNSFLGVRVRKASGDTLFGWISIEVQDYSVIYIKEHACQSLNPRDTVIALYTGLDYRNEIGTFEMEVMPNPFFESAILYANKSFSNATLTVVNSFGQTMQQINHVNGNSIRLDRNNLTSGVYWLHVTEAGQIVSVRKIIVAD